MGFPQAQLGDLSNELSLSSQHCYRRPGSQGREGVLDGPTIDSRGDLKGHIGAAMEGYTGVHGGFEYGVGNEEGRAILDFATAHDLVASLPKRSMLFPTHSQHNVLALDILFKSVQRRRERSALQRILWKNLNGDATEAFRSRVAEGVSTQVETKKVEPLWMKKSLRKDAENTSLLSSTRGNRRDANMLWILADCHISTATTRGSARRNAKMSEEWRLGEVAPIFKNKGDAQVCSNYRGIKLLGHTMKLWERVIERRLRRETSVSENQFCFMPGSSSVKAIHLIRSLMDKYRERQRDLHMAFLDLEKAYDSVPRELIWKTLVDKGTPMRYIRVIRDMYDGTKTRVRTSINTEFFPIEGEIAHNEEVDICIGDNILQPKESFRYLGSMLHKSGRIDEDVSNRIKAAWMK
ncbi:retrovirus-related pol polyprotein LINE-1 [Tanacetum coccineum]